MNHTESEYSKLEEENTSFGDELQELGHEFKKLKEKLQRANDQRLEQGKIWLEQNDILKQKLRKFEILQYNPKELEIELNKGIINRNTLQKIDKLIEEESDLDLHPEAEELDINRRIIGILDKFKHLLENP